MKLSANTISAPRRDSPQPGRATVPARYALTLISPWGDTESLGSEGSALTATWHLRRTLREEPPGSVGEARIGRHLVAKWRKKPDGSLVVGPYDPDPFAAMPEASRTAFFAAIDAYEGDDPLGLLAAVTCILGDGRSAAHEDKTPVRHLRLVTPEKP